MEKEDQKKTKRPVNINWDIVCPKNENGPPAEKEEDQKKIKRPLNLNWDVIYPKNENGPPAEKEEDHKKTKRPLNLSWDMIYPKNENGPPAEAVVVGGHFDDDKKQREADLSEITDHQLKEKIKRLERYTALRFPDKGERLHKSLKLYKDELERRNRIRPREREADLSEITDDQIKEKIKRLESSTFLRFPDKGERLHKSLKLYKDELERRNRIRPREEAECERSSQSRSSGLPGACNSYGSEAPSQAHSKSKFVSSFVEHLDDEPDLSTRVSVNPVSKKLSLVDRDNHRNTSSKGLLMNNGGREIKAMKISPPQCRGISGHVEHRSSVGAQNIIDSSRFYHSHSDGNSPVRSSKRMSSRNLVREFIELRQGEGIVVQYTTRFNELYCYAHFLVASEEQKKRKFISGLRAPLQEKLWPFFQETYSSVYIMALRLEEEMNDCRPRQGNVVRRESHMRNHHLFYRQQLCNQQFQPRPVIVQPSTLVATVSERLRLCHNCSSPDHFIRRCPLPRRGQQ